MPDPAATQVPAQILENLAAIEYKDRKRSEHNVSSDRTLHLIIVGGSANDAESLANTCRNAGLATRYRHLQRVEEMQPLLKAEDQEWDLVLAQTPESLKQALSILQKSGQDLPLIIVADAIDEDTTLAALSLGARDIVAPQPMERFLHVMLRELGDLEQRRSGRRLERELKECEQRAHALLNSSRDAIAYIHEGMHIYANPAYLELFGFQSVEDIRGTPFLDLMAPSDHARFKEFLRCCGHGETPPEPMEIKALRADGGEFRTRLEFVPAKVGGEACTQVTLRQQVADKQLQEEVARLSQQDPLTGLYNRQHFLQALQQAVDRATSGGGDSVLLYVELDDFRVIRDKVGPTAADTVLQQVSAVIRERVRSTDILGRFGDETLTLLINGDDLDSARARAEALRQSVEECIPEVDGQTVITTCSIGMCLVSDRFHNVQQALQCVEGACHSATRAGGNRVEVYQASQQEYQEEKQWPKRIQEALANNRFRLFFQPVINLHGEPRPMYQVLIRMLDEQGNTLPPKQFLSAAVKAGLMTALERWVIQRAIVTLATQRRADQPIQFLIKLSDQALMDTSLASWMNEKLNAAQVAAASLIFEVDEASAQLHLNAARDFANKLRAMHCQLALAHVGTGTNPLSVLKHLTVDYLLIDGTLIRSLDREAKQQMTVSALVQAAASMGKLVIAEHVEEASTLALLWQYGVHYAMGYYIQEPSPDLDFDFSPSV
jgi:diguanylate cyclase (GGDEF)-like protein/PAS domain S-box-containing protein